MRWKREEIVKVSSCGICVRTLLVVFFKVLFVFSCPVTYLQNANRIQILNTHTVIKRLFGRASKHVHMQTQLSWHFALLLLHSSLRRPIKSLRWWARPRLYLTNEGWLSGWRTVLVTSYRLSLHATLELVPTPSLAPSLSFLFCPLFSLLVSNHPGKRRLIIIEESKVQESSTLWTLSLTTRSSSRFLTSTSLLDKWEYVLSLANLSPLAQNGSASSLLHPPPPTSFTLILPFPSTLLSCFFSHSCINWIFLPGCFCWVSL